MNAINRIIEDRNVADNERIFRALVGVGASTAISAGVLTAPAAVFATAVVAFYLVTTAILGIDPIYNLMTRFTQPRQPRPRLIVGRARA